MKTTDRIMEAIVNNAPEGLRLVLAQYHGYIRGACNKVLAEEGALAEAEYVAWRQSMSDKLTVHPSDVDSRGRKTLRFTPEEWESLERKLNSHDALVGALKGYDSERCGDPIEKPLPNPQGYAKHVELLDCGKCKACKVRIALKQAGAPK